MNETMGKTEYTGTSFFFTAMQKIVLFNWHLLAIIRTFISKEYVI